MISIYSYQTKKLNFYLALIKRLINFAPAMSSEKTDKRAAILESARILFSELGFEGTSTRAIAKHAGANMAMINYYFGSKKGVFLEIMTHRISSFKSQLDQLITANTSPKEKILAVVEIYSKRIFENVTFHKMMHRELSLGQRPEMFSQIKDAMRTNLLTIEQIIEDGIIEGSFRKVDIPLTISTIMGTISYTALSAYKIIGKPIDMGNDEQRNELKTRLIHHLKELVTAHLMKN